MTEKTFDLGWRMAEEEINSKWKQAVQKLKEDKRLRLDGFEKVVIDRIFGELTNSPNKLDTHSMQDLQGVSSADGIQTTASDTNKKEKTQ